MLRRDFLQTAFAPLAGNLRIATFQSLITPALGQPLFTGPAKSIVDPLEARGLVLTGSGSPLVILSLDWCEIRNQSYDLWRRTLADAAGTSSDRIFLSCVHQHDAPYTDSVAQQILADAGSPHHLCDDNFERDCIRRVADSLRRSLSTSLPLTHVGPAQARVEQVASNRRYLLPDGRVSFGRTSATRDPLIRNMPEGLIDPFLKTLTFHSRDRTVAALHCYSTHPMSYYGSGDVSADFPGIARRQIQNDIPGAFHIYASGASGDTMAGRYNDGNPANRAVLASRVHAAMTSAFRSAKPQPVRKLDFRSVKMSLAPRTSKGFSQSEMTAVVRDPGQPRRARLDAALGLSWWRRVESRLPIDLPAIDFGPAALLLLPAEAFVQYQLWAQQLLPGKLVITLGYGECAPGYIPTSEAVREGYDDHYSWIDMQTCESTMRSAIQKALKGI